MQQLQVFKPYLGVFNQLIVGCEAKIVSPLYSNNPITELEMAVVCKIHYIPDPCQIDFKIPSVYVYNNNSIDASITCAPGFEMTACALSVIAPTMDYLKMELNDDTGILYFPQNKMNLFVLSGHGSESVFLNGVIR